MKITTHNANETIAFGKRVGEKLKGGEILLLFGELGSGKTTFVQGLAKGLNIFHHITSPTFTLLREYPVKKGKIKKFVHIDCYRIEITEDLFFSGAFEYFGDPATVVAIEWPDIIYDEIKKNEKKIISFKFFYTKTKQKKEFSQRIIEKHLLFNQQHEKLRPTT